MRSQGCWKRFLSFSFRLTPCLSARHVGCAVCGGHIRLHRAMLLRRPSTVWRSAPRPPAISRIPERHVSVGVVRGVAWRSLLTLSSVASAGTSMVPCESFHNNPYASTPHFARPDRSSGLLRLNMAGQISRRENAVRRLHRHTHTQINNIYNQQVEFFPIRSPLSAISIYLLFLRSSLCCWRFRSR